MLLRITLALAAALAVGAEAPATARPQPIERVTELRLYTKADSDRTVMLTFDDGPSTFTPRILDTLRRNRVPATFCLLGDNAEELPEVARRIVREGHQICNHSRTHADLRRASKNLVQDEVAVAQWQIGRATGVTPTLFRFPYGSSDKQAREIVTGAGLKELDWDVDPRDWKKPRSATLARRVVSEVRPGSVVLLHDGGGDRAHTAAALQDVITTLRKRGYRFTTP
jgi:peptidoglycan-N-acetylglucosamine deacetylase